MKALLNNSNIYFWIRNILTGGIPYKNWIELFKINHSNSRVLDLGCGPADIFRFISKEKIPGFYYGLDISDTYLKEAKKNLSQKNINHKLEVIDLTKIGYSKDINAKLKTIVKQNNLNTVLLIGVLHHLPDDAINNTLAILHKCDTIKEVYTQDIVRNVNFVNDFFVTLDRGEYIRETKDYVAVLDKTDWKISKQFWTNAGISKIKYLHFQLSK